MALRFYVLMNETTDMKVLSVMLITRVWQSHYPGCKLVGAVTHVLVNDPTRGYGIFIENMLDAAG